MAQRPSLDELLRVFQTPETGFDPTRISEGAVRGQGLADTILQKKQAQDDRVAALQEKIAQAKRQRALSSQIGQTISPLAGAAADVDSGQAAKQILEREFTEKAPKTPSFSKIGETDTEIVLADLTDPSRQARVPAIKPSKSAGKLTSIAQSKILQTEGAKGIVDEIREGVKKLPEGTLDAVAAKAQSIGRGRLPGIANDPNVTAFDAQRKSLAVAVYKFVSGDVGNIAATESKRAEDLIPSLLDSKDVRNSKVQALERAVARSRSALQTLLSNPETANMTPEQLEKAQRAIADTALAEAQAEILSTPPEPTTERKFRVIGRK